MLSIWDLKHDFAFFNLKPLNMAQKFKKLFIFEAFY